jgi:molecular chaperone DnaJ
MSARRDFYEVLEVSREASPEEIKKAFKKLALKHHPDRNPGDDEAVARFKEAAEAFEVLGDPRKRELYDRYGHDGVAHGAAGAGQSFQDLGDVFEAFGDLFEHFGLGGGGGGRSRRGGRNRPRKGPNLSAAVELDLLQAAEGCSRIVEIRRRELCTACDGSGARPGSTPARCDYCGGHGQVVQSQGFFRVQTTCPACHGEGAIVRDKCEACRGSGRTADNARLEIKVPAGIDNGMQLCLRGEGEPGTAGGPRGDLFVDVHVRPHPLFEREGSELVCHVPVTFSQLALGAAIEVPVLRGKHVLEVAAGTQPGDVVRLKGFGMPDPRGGRRGDLHVELRLEVPRKLVPRQEELLRELAELEQKHVEPHRKSFFEKLKDWIAPHDGHDAQEP